MSQKQRALFCCKLQCWYNRRDGILIIGLKIFWQFFKYNVLNFNNLNYNLMARFA